MTADASVAARALAARRRRAVFVCTVCGAEFETLARPKQLPLTCSPRCRQQAYRNRKRTIGAQNGAQSDA